MLRKKVIIILAKLKDEIRSLMFIFKGGNNFNNKNIRDKDFRFYIFSNYVYLLCLGIHFLMILLFAFLNIKIMTIFNIFSCLVYIFNLIINCKAKLSLAYHITIFEIISHSFLATVCFGWESNFYLYSIGLIIFTMFSTFLKLKVKIIEVLLITITLSISYIITADYSILYRLSRVTVVNIGLANIILSILGMSFIIYRYYKATEKLNEELRKISEIDGLTGAYNRMFFDQSLKDLVEDILEENKSSSKINLGIAIIDIDDFKRINDNYGHNVGDIYLKIFAKRLSKLNFENAIFMRISGDEFGVYIHGYDEVNDYDIKKVWEEIENKILSSQFEIQDNKHFIYCSAGMAVYAEDTNSVYELIDYADFAMYIAKKSGKNSYRRFNLEQYKSAKN